MWNSLPLKSFVISQHNKEILLMLIQSYMINFKKSSFDDFVKKKEKDLIILLQYVTQCSHCEFKHDFALFSDKPEVKKTLTMKKIAKFQKRPLYNVCWFSRKHALLFLLWAGLCWRFKDKCSAVKKATLLDSQSCLLLKYYTSSWWGKCFLKVSFVLWAQV